MRGSRCIVVAVSCLGLLWLAPAAPAALRAKASLSENAGAIRLVVKLASTKPLTARTRPRRVSVRAGERTYKLKRVRAASTAAVRLGTWRSTTLRGAAAGRLRARVGKRVVVRVRSRAGISRVRTKLAAPPAGAPAPTPAPPGDITGQPAIAQVTAALSGGLFRQFSTSGSESNEFALSLCADRRFRLYRNHVISDPQLSLVTVTEKFGSPWTVVEAVVRGGGTQITGRVNGTFTSKRVRDGSSDETTAINEPVSSTFERTNGQWRVDGAPAQHLPGQASCDPGP